MKKLPSYAFWLILALSLISAYLTKNGLSILTAESNDGFIRGPLPWIVSAVIALIISVIWKQVIEQKWNGRKGFGRSLAGLMVALILFSTIWNVGAISSRPAMKSDAERQLNAALSNIGLVNDEINGEEAVIRQMSFLPKQFASLAEKEGEYGVFTGISGRDRIYQNVRQVGLTLENLLSSADSSLAPRLQSCELAKRVVMEIKDTLKSPSFKAGDSQNWLAAKFSEINNLIGKGQQGSSMPSMMAFAGRLGTFSLPREIVGTGSVASAQKEVMRLSFPRVLDSTQATIAGLVGAYMASETYVQTQEIRLNQLMTTSPYMAVINNLTDMEVIITLLFCLLIDFAPLVFLFLPGIAESHESSVLVPAPGSSWARMKELASKN